MGAVFENKTPRFATDRQKKYFAAKKDSKDPDRRVVKHEQNLQIDLCSWIRETFPKVHFRSDTGSGAFNSNYEKNIHNKQQSAKGLPDLTIFAARRGYHALLIELKTEDAKIKRKRDAKKIWVLKKKGRVIERDYKLRKAGDWYDPHIERQHIRQVELRTEKYCATFGVGLEHCKKIICWYFDVPYTENAELFEF